MFASTIVSLALTNAKVARGAELVLNIDGIVKVKEVTLQGTRMIALAREGQEHVMTTGLDHFVMDLDLQTCYLFSFEREECVTKELFFDTHVPEEFLAGAPFSFPFKVTLEPPPPGYHFEYAGPVGYIRFYPDLKDFGYDTDYTRKGDTLLHERMKAVQAALDGPTAGELLVSGDAPPIPMPLVDTPPPIEGDSGTVIPPEEKSPPLVHRTGDPKTSHVDPKVIERVHAPLAIAPPPPAREEPLVRIDPPPPVEEDRPGTADLEAIMPMERSEELITEKLRVTTIVRLTQGEHVTEYRRVAHAYGPVFYFKDGVSCSDLVYLQGVASGPPGR